MVNFGHRNGPKGTGIGTEATACTAAFVEVDRLFAESNDIKGARSHTEGLWTMMTLDGFRHGLCLVDMDTGIEIVTIRVDFKNPFSRVADDAGNHARAAANAEFRVCFDGFIHAYLL